MAQVTLRCVFIIRLISFLRNRSDTDLDVSVFVSRQIGTDVIRYELILKCICDLV